MALRGNISAPVRVTDLVEVSKDAASRLHKSFVEVSKDAASRLHL